jgi:tetratricopeptide (TPR) repeat protein
VRNATARSAGKTLVLTLMTVSLALAAWAAGGGGGFDEDSGKPDAYRQAVKAIKEQDYKGAIDSLTKYVADHADDADGYNYLGFAYRKVGDYDNALKYYGRALELNPKHRGAHEYMGEAYLELNQPEEAKKHLAALDKLCWLPCKPYSDLKKAVAAYEKGNKPAY